MGCYDTLVDHRLNCPYCGDGVRYSQTKDLERVFEHYYICSKATHEACERECLTTKDHGVANSEQVEAIAVCTSPLCVAVNSAYKLVTEGGSTGTGRWFDVVYGVRKDDHVIHGPATITSRDRVVGDPTEVFALFEQRLDTDVLMRDAFNEVRNRNGGSLGLALTRFRYWPR